MGSAIVVRAAAFCPLPSPLFEGEVFHKVLRMQVAYLLLADNISGPLSILWCAKILPSRLWTMSRPPATIRKKAYCFQL
jgi:hypothetical protein